MRSRKRDLSARVLEYGSTERLWPSEGPLLVAVSGGADSMVLLHCLVQIRPALGLELVVGHVDHALRPSSRDDAAFVAHRAGSLGLRVVMERADVRKVALERGQTIEEAAREVRYRLLAQMARRLGSSRVATAHTATDQAETVLMRLIRGTGPTGLSGVEPLRDDGFIRPLLCATRDEVRRYALDRAILFREDPTNRDVRWLRNRVRAEVLPVLRRMNPRMDFVLADLADDARDLRDWIYSLCDGWILRDTPNECRIPTARWFSLHEAVRPYAILHAFHDLTGAPLGLARSHVRAVLRVASSVKSGVAVLHLPRGVVVRWDQEGLRMTLEGPRARQRPRSRDLEP